MVKKTVFSLEGYQKDADKNFSQYDIRVNSDLVVTLKNPLRIPDAKRDQLFAIVDGLSFDGDTPSADDMARITPLMLQILRLVGDENVERLVEKIEGDLSVIMAIFQDYVSVVGLGEASPSES